MKKIILLLTSTLLISACVTGRPGSAMYEMTKPSDEELNNQQITECLKLGFQPNTDVFANCRLRMKEIDAQYEGTGSRR